MLVKDVRKEGNWDFTNSFFDFPLDILERLKAMTFPLFSRSEDRVVWASSPTGSFDSKSVYSIAASKSNLNPLFTRSWIWKLDTLCKIQCFLWKCHFHRIPTKDVLEIKGFVGARYAKCSTRNWNPLSICLGTTPM